MLNYRDFRERSRSFESLAAIEENNAVALTDVGEGPDLVTSPRVSPEFFEVLNVSLALGRPFLPEEYSVASDNTVLLSYGAWQRYYGETQTLSDSPRSERGHR